MTKYVVLVPIFVLTKTLNYMKSYIIPNYRNVYVGTLLVFFLYMYMYILYNDNVELF